MRIAILCSGGDAPGMNPVIRAVVRSAESLGHETVGVRRGFRGLIEGEFVSLGARDVGGILDRGGTVLLSSREEKFRKLDYREKAYRNLQRENVDALVVLGGEGTFKGAELVAEEMGIPVIGVPCTIDNDVGGTEYCIGYDTALRNAVDAIDKIRDTASSHERIFVVEVMGRKRGFIAVEAGLATGAELILVPEEEFPKEKIPEEIVRVKELGKLHFIIVMAEGYGKAEELREFLLQNIGERFGEIRATVLGHLQRGGVPTHTDRIMGMKFGEVAVESLLSGERKGFVAYRGGKFYIEDFSMAGEYKDIDREALRLNRRLNS
ncbi:ATP-dependent 6-phosphofructokinase [Hydrogenivirga sp. 128-5-R1-1]|uniref:ATP-dependent 6-phosphofructokinase n=1 Tax=Hydrogenivirga sp. 128-5-R1-1 TaxID=392423 RepID=UPI00015EF9ED|nr:ATP-dependent 6-phosphofructokinase [Hydrogenivirga sp. 128-5-R1-1]EDP74551.1 6-phosphofructokinase [Hydrogenivirga sp. 128-5-R1-1]